MSQNRRTELRVGIFVTVALVVGGALAFIIGNQRNLFTPKVTYSAVFDDVGGLRAGNGVNVAGVGVGTVEGVEFMSDGRVRVTFEVVDSAAQLIRGNPNVGVPSDEDAPQPSMITIGSKGMLGDKQLEVSVGDESLEAWPADQPMLVNTGSDLFAQAASIAGEAEGVMHNVRRMTDPFADQEFSRDVQTMADNLAQITGMLATGDGAVQRLMTDPSTADEIDATLRNFRATSSELARMTRSIRLVVDEVRTGDGSAHALVYGDEGRQAMANVSQVTGELAQVLGEVRTGDGTVHDLIYEDSADEIVANVTRITDDMAHISGEVRAGRGTIGGLLVDPSIYEDVKRLVGDLERNDILRALVRYSIRRDEAEQTPAVEAQ